MSGSLLFGKKPARIKLSRREDIEPHEIFCDRAGNIRDRDGKPAEKKVQVAVANNFLFLPLVAAALFFLAVLARTGQIQAFQGRELGRSAEQNKYLFHKVQSDRGIIYDSNFDPLVANLSAFDLQCQNSRMPAGGARGRFINGLAALLGKDPRQLEADIVSEKNPTVENLDHKALIVLEARAADFGACAIVERPIRDYRRGAGLAHLLGYMSKITQEEWQAAPEMYSINDYIGRSGLEKSYEAVLRKNPGKMRLERDAKGNLIGEEIAAPPQSGDSVQLWLDYDLQEKIYAALAKQLESLGLKKGAAVALDPKTGGVMAMVSFPDYDNNVFSSASSSEVKFYLEDKNNPLFNRVISGKYLTGSTIKPLEAAAALQEKIIAAEKSIDCKGGLTIQDAYNPEKTWFIPDNHTHGLTNMYKAIAESCNAYFQTIGGGYGNQQGLGVSRIKKYLDLFGWEDATGIDLPGETAGFVPDPAWKKEKFAGTQDQSWSDGDTYNLAIGQGFIGITPLEVAAAYAAIANGGTLYRPQMVKNIVDKDKKTIEEKQPQIIRQNFIDPQNLAVVREGMRHCVNGVNAPLASALTLNQLGIPMGAKTGTAQLRKGPDGKDLLNAWVGAFAPYDDPRIVLLVMAEDVREGTVAVLPVAKEVLGWYFEPKDANGIRVSDSLAATTTENVGANDYSP